MGVTLQDLQDLRSGWREPIVVGELPNNVRLQLQLRVPKVHLSGASLAHIARKHPDVTDLDLLFLTPTIEKGMVMRELAKPNVLIAVYQDPTSHRRWAAVMKIASDNCEVWLQSFRRAHARQTRQWLKRCKLMLKHARN